MSAEIVKEQTNSKWNIVYMVAGLIVIACLLGMGFYAVYQSFQQHPVQITNASKIPPKELVSAESYKATYDLFSTQFSQLLTFLGIFGTIFGLVIPAGAYLLQRQNLQDEREKLQKEMEKINLAEQHLKDIKDIQKDQFITEKTSFHAVVALAAFILNDTKDPHKKAQLLHIILVAFDNAVNCVTKANDSFTLYELMNNTLNVLEKFLTPERQEIFEAAIFAMKQGNIVKNDAHFVSGEKIMEVLGLHNKDLFARYRKIYEQIYPWKFNGQQKKGLDI